MEKTYRISELFYSLQGEGYWTGKSAVFVRFAGCNLQCPFCDTDHQVRSRMNAQHIAEVCAENKRAGMIVLTGGEPMTQIDENLVDEIKKATNGSPVAIETNGTIRPSKELREKLNWIVCSPKSTELLKNELVDWVDEFKFIVNSDFLDEKNKYIEFATFAKLKNKKIFLQACDEDYVRQRNLEEAVKIVKEYGDIFRLSLQTQKILNIK